MVHLPFKDAPGSGGAEGTPEFLEQVDGCPHSDRLAWVEGGGHRLEPLAQCWHRLCVVLCVCAHVCSGSLALGNKHPQGRAEVCGDLLREEGL